MDRMSKEQVSLQSGLENNTMTKDNTLVFRKQKDKEAGFSDLHRTVLGSGGAQVWADLESMLNATDGCGEGASSVGKRDLELGETLKNTTHHHGTDRDGGLTGHTNQPGEPVLLHSALVVHVPRVYKNDGVGFLAGSPDGVEFGGIEVPVVDVASNLDTGQAKLFTTTLQFLNSQLGSLHGERSETNEALGVLGDDLSNVIVQVSGEIEGVLRAGRIVEHHWDR